MNNERTTKNQPKNISEAADVQHLANPGTHLNNGNNANNGNTARQADAGKNKKKSGSDDSYSFCDKPVEDIASFQVIPGLELPPSCLRCGSLP